MKDKPIGTLVKEFLMLKRKISKKNKEIDELKSSASDLEKEIIKALESNKSTGEKITMGSVNLKKEPVFTADDWPTIWKWIFKKKDSALVQKRLSQSLLKEYMEEGVTVPGIKKMTKKSLTYGFSRKV